MIVVVAVVAAAVAVAVAAVVAADAASEVRRASINDAFRLARVLHRCR